MLIEDLVSTGGSSASAIEALQEEGGKVIAMQAIVSYGFPVADSRLAELAVPWHALARYEDLGAIVEPDAETEKLLLDWRAGFSR